MSSLNVTSLPLPPGVAAEASARHCIPQLLVIKDTRPVNMVLRLRSKRMAYHYIPSTPSSQSGRGVIINEHCNMDNHGVEQNSVVHGVSDEVPEAIQPVSICHFLSHQLSTCCLCRSSVRDRSAREYSRKATRKSSWAICQ